MDDLARALREAHPELETVREVSRQPVYLVGGAVRDLLLGRPTADVDLMVEGDARALAAQLGGGNSQHEGLGAVKGGGEGDEDGIVGARTRDHSQTRGAPGAH